MISLLSIRDLWSSSSRHWGIAALEILRDIHLLQLSSSAHSLGMEPKNIAQPGAILLSCREGEHFQKDSFFTESFVNLVTFAIAVQKVGKLAWTNRADQAFLVHQFYCLLSVFARQRGIHRWGNSKGHGIPDWRSRGSLRVQICALRGLHDICDQLDGDASLGAPWWRAVHENEELICRRLDSKTADTVFFQWDWNLTLISKF